MALLLWRGARLSLLLALITVQDVRSAAWARRLTGLSERQRALRRRSECTHSYTSNGLEVLAHICADVSQKIFPNVFPWQSRDRCLGVRFF